MADAFQSQPNFVNPQYATPEQLATQRAYAAALMKRAPEGATRPTGAAASILDSITSVLERKRADELQSEAAARNSGRLGDLISQLQKGQRPDAQNLGQIYADPMASPEARATVSQLIGPQKVEDVRGRPAYMSPAMGVQAAPINGNFEPGFRAPESAGSVSTTTPFPAPMSAAPRAPVASSPKVWGDREAEAAGLYPPSTPQAARGGVGATVAGAGPLPSAPAPAASVGSRIDALAAKDRELSAEKNRTEGGAKAEGEVILKDVTRAAAAPETLKGLGIMKNTIQSVGDRMTFGPTAKFSNEARRVIANYAPGLVDEKALAGSDAIEKLNLGLAGAVSQQLGLNPSDIYRSVASVPGNEKSKEGTLALIDMMEQQARNDQYVGTTLYQQHQGNLAGYQQARADYYASHPIINPITRNPIEVDAQRAAANPAANAPVRVNTPDEARRLPSGTLFIDPNGVTRRVP